MSAFKNMKKGSNSDAASVKGMDEGGAVDGNVANADTTMS
jgi:hypothetical protein